MIEALKKMDEIAKCFGYATTRLMVYPDGSWAVIAESPFYDETVDMAVGIGGLPEDLWACYDETMFIEQVAAYWYK